MYKKALTFAAIKHKGHTRRNGSPYLIHLIRVASEMRTNEEKVVALLHDTIEDTQTTYAEIKQEFGNIIANAVEAITHRKGESYKEYILRVKENNLAKAVKIADISDNLSDQPSEHAIKKSAYALEELINE